MTLHPPPSCTPVASLPRAHGWPRSPGVLRAEPEDFRVDELLAFEPSDDGDHWLLRVEKIGCNTQWAARTLARHAGVPLQRIGYAGLKDRHALARQWFSVQCPRLPVDWAAFDGGEVRIREVRRNRRKLQRGALRGNRFEIRARGVRVEGERWEEQFAHLARRGVPNYFTEQRFGIAGGNLAHAHELFTGAAERVSRYERGLYLSAARSQLFNEVLADRVRSGDWDRCLPGDRCMLDGTRSSFAAVDVDEALGERCDRGDIHPSGPLWGKGETLSSGSVAERERMVLADFAVWQHGLAANGLKQERRALRVIPRDLWWEHAPASDLRLGFFLPAGSYATSVLREVIEQRA